MELVLFSHKTDNKRQAQVVDLEQAVVLGWLKDEDRTRSPQTSESRPLNKLSSQALNLMLNIDGAMTSETELWVWALIGFALQVAALIFPAWATYQWRWLKGAETVRPYAYPCYLAGSFSLIVGLIFCSHVIEAVSEERKFVPQNRKEGEIRTVFRVQMACTLGDQSFPSSLIVNSPGDNSLRTSTSIRISSAEVSSISL